jgi:hypothetical protein
VAVAGLLAVACGSSGSSSGSGDTDRAGPRGEATFCETWEALDAMEGSGDLAVDFGFLLTRIEVMAENVPADLVVEVDRLGALLGEDAALLERYGWDYANVFSDPDAADELDAAFEREDQIVSLVGNGPLAVHAFEECDGAGDPRFNLPCNVTRFEEIRHPDATTTTAPPAPEEPPDRLADALLSGLDGAVEWASRPFEDGVGHEYAFVDERGVPLLVVQFAPGEGGWVQTDSLRCDDDEDFVDIGEPLD